MPESTTTVPETALEIEGVMATMRCPLSPSLEQEQVWVVCDSVPRPETCAGIARAISPAPETVRPGMDHWRQWAEQTMAPAGPPPRTFLSIMDAAGWRARLQSGDHALELSALHVGALAGSVQALNTRRPPTLADFVLSPEEGILTFQQILAELVVNTEPYAPGSDTARTLAQICDTFREQSVRNALRVTGRPEAESSDVHSVMTALAEDYPAWTGYLRAPAESATDPVEQLVDAFERIAHESGLV